MKFIGIFSENRKEWFMTELAACGDSICVVPLAVQQQFMTEERISKIINDTNLSTLCVTKKTAGIILELKSRGKINTLDHLIFFDQPEEIHLSLAKKVSLSVNTFKELV